MGFELVRNGDPIAMSDEVIRRESGSISGRAREVEMSWASMMAVGIPGQPGSGMGINYFDRLLSNEEVWMIYKQVPDVRACVDKITLIISTWDWDVVPKIPAEDPRHEYAIEVAARAKARLQVPSSDDTTWQDELSKAVRDLCVFDSFAWAINYEDGALSEFYAVRGCDILPLVDRKYRRLGYSALPMGGSPTFIPKEEVLYANLSPSTTRPGGNPIIETIVNEVIIMLASAKNAGKELDGTEVAPGILVLRGIGTEAQARKLGNKFTEQKGQDDVLRMIFGDNPDLGAEWVPFKRDFKDVEFLGVTKETQRIIWRCFGMMPAAMGDTESTPRATAEVQADAQDSNLIRPILELLQPKVNTKILAPILGPEDAELVEFRFDLEQAKGSLDKLNDTKADAERVDRGALTINEWRAQDQLAPVEGGDIPLVLSAGGYKKLADIVAGDTDQDEAMSGAGKEPEEEGEDDELDAEEEDLAELAALERDSETFDSLRATNFPDSGGNAEVSLSASAFPVFRDVAYIDALRRDWPQLWARGGNAIGNTQFRRLRPVVKRGGKPTKDEEKKAIRLREVWAKRRAKGRSVAAVVAQMKSFVVGALGEKGMKACIDAEKKRQATRAHPPKYRALNPSIGAMIFRAELVGATDMPSDWQPEGKFRGMRTLDLPELAASIQDYVKGVRGLWMRYRTDTVAAFAAALADDKLTEEERARLFAQVDSFIEGLHAQWTTRTHRDYVRAAELGRIAAKAWTGNNKAAKGWKDQARAYQLKAMDYLVDANGLLTELRNQLRNILIGIREITTPGFVNLGAKSIVVKHPNGTETVSSSSPALRRVSEQAAAILAAVMQVFDRNEFRIDNWAGRLVELASDVLTNGLTEVDSGSNSTPPPDSDVEQLPPGDWLVEWVSVDDASTCRTCLREGAAGFRPLDQVKLRPGGGTECRARCRCVLVFWTREEVYNGTAKSFAGKI